MPTSEAEFTIELNTTPSQYSLSQNFPNPFNPETKIQFDIPGTRTTKANTRLAIYNASGQLVRVLVDEMRAPGSYEVQWDGRDNLGQFVASGIYIYKLISGDFVSTKKMILLR